MLLKVSALLRIPHRTTYILKRRTPIPASRPNSKKFSPLNEDSKVYELVEDTDDRETFIDVVLTEFVEDIGKRGQIVKMESKYAYSDLILPGRAVYATPENIAKQKILAEEDIDKYSSLTAYKTMKQLNKTCVTIYMNMYQPWILEPRHIRINMRMQGIEVLKDESIQLPEKPISGPDFTLEGKDFAVIVKINNIEQAVVRCRLRHWTSKYAEKIPLPPDHECVDNGLIFEDQAELLKNNPLPKPAD